MIKLLCPVKEAKITSKYGRRIDPIDKVYAGHMGVDLQGPTRTSVPIYAAEDGVVTVVKSHPTLGNYIIISHNDISIDTLYAHLSTMTVSVGTKVKKGHLIGMMGNTGKTTGIHLHFEVHQGGYKYSNGQPVNVKDPMTFISLDYDIRHLKNDKEGKVEMNVELLKEINDLKKRVSELEKFKPRADLVEPHISHAEHWKWATENGLINGQKPGDFVTRQQLSTVLYRIFNLITGKGKKK